jgi:hypothetical protein
MKLNAIHIDQTRRQFGAEAIPENHPAAPRLNSLFGEHTFFLDESGLNIVELVTPEDETAALAGGTAEAVRVVKLASWADETHTSLAPHEREITDVVVVLDRAH